MSKQQTVDVIVTRQVNVEADPTGNILRQIHQEIQKIERVFCVIDYTEDDEDDLMYITDCFC
jgi:hypothetical protein